MSDIGIYMDDYNETIYNNDNNQLNDYEKNGPKWYSSLKEISN